MQNIIKNTVNLSLVISVLITHTSCAKDPKEGYKGVGGIGMEKVANSINRLSDVIDGLDAPKVIDDATGKVTDSFNKVADAFNDVKTELKGLRRDAKIGAATLVVAGGGVYAYKCCNPNQKEQLSEEEAAGHRLIHQLEAELCDSLARHAYEEKNAMGIPCACEEAANKYVAAAGFAALTKIVKEFKEAYRN